MARILIAYTSKTGTAEECVQILQKELKGMDVDAVNLEEQTALLEGYDAVILGSSIRFGRIRPKMKAFLSENSAVLEKIPHGLFLCCGFGHDFEEYSQKQFSRSLRDSAFAVLNFGGRLKQERASLLERYYLYRVRCAIRESEIEDGEYTPTLPGLLPENISMMVSALRRSL